MTNCLKTFFFYTQVMLKTAVHIRKFHNIGYDSISVINANILHCLPVKGSYKKINVAGVKPVLKNTYWMFTQRSQRCVGKCHKVWGNLWLIKLPLMKPDGFINFEIRTLSLSNGTTARGGPRPPSRVSSILSGLGQPPSSSYTLALPHPLPLRLPSAAWVSLWGAFLLAH